MFFVFEKLCQFCGATIHTSETCSKCGAYLGELWKTRRSNDGACKRKNR